MTPTAPHTLHTERLRLRAFAADDAPHLLPLLEANVDHLSRWIPEHVWRPAPLPELSTRLDGFAAAFDADRQWRYAIWSPDSTTLIGEVDLFPRDTNGRVPYEHSDRAEIGYWVRADMASQGLATEAARAMLTLAASLPRFTHVLIRCDALNVPSNAVPQRLGFARTDIERDGDDVLHIWTLPLR
ncbi:MAG: GNAT family N-acetyltransferase [Gemmatimonadaceae bacterium]|nr:GNAT family N-acetyltransferase [Gemmatimonadaceae bacterium]